MSVTAVTPRARAALEHAANGPVTVPRLPAREAAEQELSKRMYHENDPSLLERALEHFWNWVGELLHAATGATPGGAFGIAVVVVLVLLLVIGLILRLGPARRTPAARDELFDNRPRSAAEYRAAAELHASRQRWGAAIQEQLRAIVRSLEERALLDPRPGRTADEAADEAGRALPEHAERLHQAARTFDEVTYGGRKGSAEEYLRVQETDGILRGSRPVLPTADPLGAVR
ncbi:DUF4129 domain-containing protein [Streptomyces sp. TP-A0874]|uniref:DUF4129 domain-containing protein n=1 Tax=Streptomyces sp. TP-A0874 TaxID=549819 RepID=UPI000853E782|nr:DUF4129 domain-containing protein [Streptomyces sp. TP-A0874]